MHAESEANNKQTITLPLAPIVRFEGKQFAYVVKRAGEYEMVKVNVGETENGFTEITLSANSDMVKADFVTKGVIYC